MSDITVVLNKEAVDALFPEGSEARLQLARSAIQSVVKNVVKPTQISAELLKIVGQHVEKLKQEVLKEAGVMSGMYFGTINFSKEFDQRIRHAAREAVDREIRGAINPAVAEAVQNIVPQISERVERSVETEVRAIVSRSIKLAVDGALGVKAGT